MMESKRTGEYNITRAEINVRKLQLCKEGLGSRGCPQVSAERKEVLLLPKQEGRVWQSLGHLSSFATG